MNSLTPLSLWLDQQPNNVVAYQSGKSITKEVFLLRVQGWMDALCSQKGQRWAVCHSDSLEFLCILIALWQLECTACIPNDNRPATVERLSGSIDGLVGEFPSSSTAVSEFHDVVSVEIQWITPKPDFIALEIYTSGSTGDPKSITKTISQLEREIEVLEALWPSEPGSVVLATVSHQHIYGMIFGMFWPFCSKRAFESKTCEFSEDILYKAKCYPRFSLISSPSHLGRLGESTDWGEIAGRCNYVVSAAAPLTREDSINAGQLLDAPVREIYGSSETGAIAWRVQLASDTEALWNALPQVDLEPAQDGTLRLRSPYLGELDYFELPDRVEFNEQGCFRLKGRLDRIVKVEGKRVSLASIEQMLLENDWVNNVKALTIERARVETAIVMQLSMEGQARLQTLGRRSLISIFRNVLASNFEAVVLPRRWRFVEQMPFNRQGKLPLGSLQALFDAIEIKWPKIIEQQIIDGQAIMRCYIPAQLIYFDGHMADRPILPGIVQVHWAEAYGRSLLPVEGRFERLEVVKFQQVILPEYEVTIGLEYNDASNKLSFRYESDRGIHSSGRICFA